METITFYQGLPLSCAAQAVFNFGLPNCVSSTLSATPYSPTCLNFGGRFTAGSGFAGFTRFGQVRESVLLIQSWGFMGSNSARLSGF